MLTKVKSGDSQYLEMILEERLSVSLGKAILKMMVVFRKTGVIALGFYLTQRFLI